jgi:hypothetical protein
VVDDVAVSGAAGHECVIKVPPSDVHHVLVEMQIPTCDGGVVPEVL